MNKIMSVNFWVSTFTSTLLTMVFIYLIKVVFGKVNVPVVSDIGAQV